MSTNSPPTINDCAQNCIANKLGVKVKVIASGNLGTDYPVQYGTVIKCEAFYTIYICFSNSGHKMYVREESYSTWYLYTGTQVQQ